MRKIGTKRSDFVCFRIGTAAPCAASYGSAGYVSDLRYYQGDETYYKLGRLLANGSITQEQHDEIKRVLLADDEAHQGE